MREYCVGLDSMLIRTQVFHGAFMDMMWLQRDLGLYVVGLFDTFHASKALGYPKRSLAALLDRFVNLKADKSYQTADWRTRYERPATLKVFLLIML